MSNFQSMLAMWYGISFRILLSAKYFFYLKSDNDRSRFSPYITYWNMFPFVLQSVYQNMSNM